MQKKKKLYDLPPSGLESREYGGRIRHADHVATPILKSWH
jgi:hypothetical protein